MIILVGEHKRETEFVIMYVLLINKYARRFSITYNKAMYHAYVQQAKNFQ